METKDTIYLRKVSHKIVTDANGVEHKERVFTLLPVKAKDKVRLTKEEVIAKKKAKKEQPYMSPFLSKKGIPTIPVEKDKDGKIIPKNDIYSDIGLQALKDYRAIKKQYDDETTEIITLPNGFKRKIKIKLDFRPLPSAKLSVNERETRIQEHKKTSKARRVVRNARIKYFRTNPTPYEYKGYTSDTKLRKEKQTKFWENHTKKINAIIESMRKAKEEKKKLKIVKVYNINGDCIRRTVKPTVAFEKGMNTIQSIVKNNKAKDAVHVFGIDKKDNIPAMGMKIAA